MPYISLPNAKLFYQESGSGSETLVFSHGLLWSHKMFAAQVAEPLTKSLLVGDFFGIFTAPAFFVASYYLQRRVREQASEVAA